MTIHALEVLLARNMWTEEVMCLCVYTVCTSPSRSTGRQFWFQAWASAQLTPPDLWEVSVNLRMTALDPGHFPWFKNFMPLVGATGCPPLLISTQRESPLTPENSAFWKLPRAGMPLLFLRWCLTCCEQGHTSVHPKLGLVSFALCVCLSLCFRDQWCS